MMMNFLRYSNQDVPPVIFGTRIDAQSYQFRPGVYGVILNDQHNVALIRTNRGYFLPGGGKETHESPKETLQREICEECGYRVAIGHELGQTIEYIFAQREGTYFEIQSVFFEARFTTRLHQPFETDHQLVWCSLTEGAQFLVRKSQIWALSQVNIK